MLAEIYKKLGLRGEIDPDLLQSAIVDKHLWALDWKYDLLTSDKDDTSKSVLTDVVNALDTFSMVEKTYANYLKKGNVKLEHDFFLTFNGYDGNNETNHMSTVQFLVEKMDRFSEFLGREFNSHAPNVSRYKRMVSAFAPMRTRMGETHNWDLTKDQLEKLLAAAGSYD